MILCHCPNFMKNDLPKKVGKWKCKPAGKGRLAGVGGWVETSRKAGSSSGSNTVLSLSLFFSEKILTRLIFLRLTQIQWLFLHNAQWTMAK